MLYTGVLCSCGSAPTIFLYICFLLDVERRSNALHDVGHCVQ